MRLIRRDLAEQAVGLVRDVTEWPHYSIFIYLRCFDVVVISPRSYLHGDLLVMLREDWQRHGYSEDSIADADVFDGHIEWEDDGSFRILTERGQRLPKDIESRLISTLKHIAE